MVPVPQFPENWCQNFRNPHRAKKAPSAVRDALGLDFRGHDLRRTAATHMAAAGVPRGHIAHVLNHVEGGARATRVYDRHSYDREKRTALEAWARSLEPKSSAAGVAARRQSCPSGDPRDGSPGVVVLAGPS